jgi:hypothetical protein
MIRISGSSHYNGVGKVLLESRIVSEALARRAVPPGRHHRVRVREREADRGLLFTCEQFAAFDLDRRGLSAKLQDTLPQAYRESTVSLPAPRSFVWIFLNAVN